MDTIKFFPAYLETVEGGYACSRRQAAAILGRKKKAYKQDTELAGDDAHCDLQEYRVVRLKSGIRVGCHKFNKQEIALIRKWLKSKP